MPTVKSLWLAAPTLLALLGFPLFVLSFTTSARVILGSPNVDFYLASYETLLSKAHSWVQEYRDIGSSFLSGISQGILNILQFYWGLKSLLDTVQETYHHLHSCVRALLGLFVGKEKASGILFIVKVFFFCILAIVVGFS